MKKVLLIDICVIALALVMVSCTGAPESRESTAPAQGFPGGEMHILDVTPSAPVEGSDSTVMQAEIAEHIFESEAEDTFFNGYLTDIMDAEELEDFEAGLLLVEADQAIFDEDFPDIDFSEDEAYELYYYLTDFLDPEELEGFQTELLLAENGEEFPIEDNSEPIAIAEVIPSEPPMPEPVVPLPEPPAPEQPPVIVSPPAVPPPASPPISSPPTAVPPPPVAVTPSPEQPPVIVTPPVTPPPPPPAAVTPPPVPPPIAPAPVTPPPPVVSAAEPEPPAEVQPPAIVREPPSGNTPELPSPTPAFTGQQDDRIVFSRIAHATVGQWVEVPFRGTGWEYLGEAAARRGIVYDTRRPDPEGQSFIFRTESAGVYVLRFYRQDFVRDIILNDYVQVVVSEAPETVVLDRFNRPADPELVIAGPRWPSSIEEASRSDARPPQQVSPPAPPSPSPAPQPSPPPPAPPVAPPRDVAVQPEPVSPSPPAITDVQPPAAPDTPALELPEDYSPDEYIRRAREEFDAGRIAPAISLLDQFCRFYPSGSDEAWWLYAQCYEASGPSRNINAALDYYRRLVNEYPQSSHIADARRRISYLERFYINIQ